MPVQKSDSRSAATQPQVPDNATRAQKGKGGASKIHLLNRKSRSGQKPPKLKGLNAERQTKASGSVPKTAKLSLGQVDLVQKDDLSFRDSEKISRRDTFERALKTPERQLLDDLEAAGLHFKDYDSAMAWIKKLDRVLHEKIDAGLKKGVKQEGGSPVMSGKMKSVMNSYTRQDPLTEDRSDFSRYMNEVDNAIWTLAVSEGGALKNRKTEDDTFLSDAEIKTALTRKVCSALENYNKNLNIDRELNPDQRHGDRLGPATRDLAVNHDRYAAAQVYPGKHHMTLFKKAVAEYSRGASDLDGFLKSAMDILGQTGTALLAAGVGSALADIDKYAGLDPSKKTNFIDDINDGKVLSDRTGDLFKAYFPNSLATSFNSLQEMRGKEGRKKMKQVLKDEKRKLKQMAGLKADKKPKAGTPERGEFEKALRFQRIKTENLEKVIEEDPVLLQRLLVARQLGKSVKPLMGDKAAFATNVAMNALIVGILEQMTSNTELKQAIIKKAIDPKAEGLHSDIQQELIGEGENGKLNAPANRAGGDDFQGKAIKGILDPIISKRGWGAKAIHGLFQPLLKLLNFVFPRTSHNVKSMSVKDFFTSRQGARALLDAVKDVLGTPLRGITAGVYAIKNIVLPLLNEIVAKPLKALGKSLWNEGRPWSGIPKTAAKGLLLAVSIAVSPLVMLGSLGKRIYDGISDALHKRKSGGGILKPNIAAENAVKQFQNAVRNEYDLNRMRNKNLANRLDQSAMYFDVLKSTVLANTAANGLAGNVAYFGVLGATLLYNWGSDMLGKIRLGNKNQMETSLASQTYRYSSLYQKARNLENELDTMIVQNAQTYTEHRCRQLAAEANQILGKHDLAPDESGGMDDVAARLDNMRGQIETLPGDNCGDIQRLGEISTILRFSARYPSGSSKEADVMDLGKILKHEEFLHTCREQLSRLDSERGTMGKQGGGEKSGRHAFRTFKRQGLHPL